MQFGNCFWQWSWILESQGEDGADTLTSWYTRCLLVQISFDIKVVSLWQMFSYYIWTYAFMVSHWTYMKNFVWCITTLIFENNSHLIKDYKPIDKDQVFKYGTKV